MKIPSYIRRDYRTKRVTKQVEKQGGLILQRDVYLWINVLDKRVCV